MFFFFVFVFISEGKICLLFPPVAGTVFLEIFKSSVIYLEIVEVAPFFRYQSNRVGSVNV